MNTSQLAKQQFEIDFKKEKHYKAILRALKMLGSSCSKGIAKHSNLRYVQVSRRVLELINLGDIKIVDQRKTKYYKTKVNIYALN